MFDGVSNIESFLCVQLLRSFNGMYIFDLNYQNGQ